MRDAHIKICQKWKRKIQTHMLRISPFGYQMFQSCRFQISIYGLDMSPLTFTEIVSLTVIFDLPSVETDAFTDS